MPSNTTLLIKDSITCWLCSFPLGCKIMTCALYIVSSVKWFPFESRRLSDSWGGVLWNTRSIRCAPPHPHPMCHHLDCFPALLPSSSFPCDAFASHGTFLRCHNKQSFQCCDWSVPWDTVLFDNTWVKQRCVYRCDISPTAGWSKNSKYWSFS